MAPELNSFLAGFGGGGLAASLISLLLVRLHIKHSTCNLHYDDFMIGSKVDGLTRDMQTMKIQIAALNAEVYKPFDSVNE